MFPRCCVQHHCDVIKYIGLLPEQLRCQYRVWVRACVCVREKLSGGAEARTAGSRF